MRNIHRSRIDGFILLMFSLGAAGGYFLGLKVLIIIVPVTCLWLMTYDEYSYEEQKTKKSS